MLQGRRGKDSISLRQMLSGVSEASLAEVGLPLAPGDRAVLPIGAELGPGPDSPSRDRVLTDILPLYPGRLWPPLYPTFDCYSTVQGHGSSFSFGISYTNIYELCPGARHCLGHWRSSMTGQTRIPALMRVK